MGCANRGGGPQGGPKDIAPPIPIKSTPTNGATNHTNPTIDIYFDEIVLLEKSYEKIVVSPPQLKSPVVKAYGRKVSVELLDSLKANTTYIVDFSDAIVDNNEKNKLVDYYFTFSTGNDIDSLMIGGTLIDARNLNPKGGVLVGIHSNLNDSAFQTLPFERVSKTNDKGEFWIKGVKKGAYKVFALGDLNSNYMADQPIEPLAFLDSIVVPDVTFAEHLDTIWKDSTTIDTIVKRQHPNFTASNLLLRYFEPDFTRQYLVKAERVEPYKLSFYFNAPLDTLPVLQPLNFKLDHNYLLQQSAHRDTLTYWFTDTLISQIDTLSYALTYLKTDSTNQLSAQTDTLNTVARRKVDVSDKSTGRSSRSKDNDAKKKIEFLPIKTNSSTNFDVYNSFILTFDKPTKYDVSKPIVVELKVDSLWQKMDIKLHPDDSLGLQYSLQYNWQPEKMYRLKVDSAAFVALDGLHTNTYESTFKIRSLESYATLFIMMDKLSGGEILELLDKNEKVIRTVKATKETAFEYLNPDDYYLRLFVDENGNNKWDTGDYTSKKQAEDVYYFPFKFTLRAFWEVEENWDYKALPILKQKPEELIKSSMNKKKTK
ncbi:MAG TPA: Ig-like domain-containing protein [Paludibacteraceae bacterium]|nr:Ig-like domain-containing protein [Paludibacteraceae bacterium]